jgi:hypothetical protein
MKTVLIICIFPIGIFSHNLLYGQESLTIKTKNWKFSTSYFQIKDQLNYGLVFNGGTINFGYGSSRIQHNKIFAYEGNIGFGPGFSKGMTMIQSQFKFLDIFYGFAIGANENSNLFIGPYVSSNIQYQFYPETHGGLTSWFSIYDLGLKLEGSRALGKNLLSVYMSTSLIGLASRPEADRDPYNYSLNFGDFISNAHSNMEVGSFNLLNHTQISVEYIIKGGKRKKSIGYQFEYMEYAGSPSYKFINNSVCFNLYLKKYSK